jgi:serine protease Do
MLAILRSGRVQATMHWRIGVLAAIACCLPLAAMPLRVYGGSREAVARAVAATVAVEWRADQPAEQPANQPAEPANPPAEPANQPAQPADSQPEAPTEETSESPPGAPPTQAVVPTVPRRGPVMRVSRNGKPILPTPAFHPGDLVSFHESGLPDLSLASGTVVSADGLIVAFNPTHPNASAGAGRHTVTFDDGRTFAARLLVDDRRNGLELLKIDAQDLAHVSPADDDAQLGDQVYATFATDGRQRAAAQGMVAARKQSSDGRSGRLLQADINVGQMSAGGPLVDGGGRLVGILVARSASASGPRGAGFAVPVSAVRALIAARQGDDAVVVQHGFLGVRLEQRHEEGGQTQVIMSPFAGSPAAAAGVREGDVLLMIDGEQISSASDATAIVAEHAPGDTIAVVVMRDGKREARAITLGERPAVNAQNSQSSQAPAAPQPVLKAIGPDRILFRLYDKALIAHDGPVVNTIRVERSDVEKQLESVGHDVQSLSEQVKKLTEEVQRLREQLSRDE